MIHRKETLVITAVNIIHEKGLQGLSTREVAQQEGVSEATIFKHFKTKNDLILAVLDHFSQYDNALVESATSKEMTPREMIVYIIESTLSYYESYPEITAVLQTYVSMFHEAELKDRAHEIFSSRARTLKCLIERAKEAKEINPHVDSEILTDIILGTITRIIIKWRSQNYEFSLKEYTLSAITLILDSVATEVE